MRLRQLALVAKDLEPVAAQLAHVFGLKVGYRDPAVAKFGLVNVVMPAGGEFIEIVQPTRQDVSAARYLTRRGGDAGYMVILQDADALAHRDRLAKAGVRVIEELDRGAYQFAHYHPGDFGGVLASIDTVKGDADWRADFSDWPPCGREWRDAKSTNAAGVSYVAIQAKNPAEQAQLWAQRLEKPQRENSVVLDQGEIRFVPPVDADGTGVVEIGIAVRDVGAAQAAARDAQSLDKNGRAQIGGVAFAILDAAAEPRFAARLKA